jgi:hypothetical protein
LSSKFLLLAISAPAIDGEPRLPHQVSGRGAFGQILKELLYRRAIEMFEHAGGSPAGEFGPRAEAAGRFFHVKSRISRDAINNGMQVSHP